MESIIEWINNISPIIIAMATVAISYYAFKQDGTQSEFKKLQADLNQIMRDDSEFKVVTLMTDIPERILDKDKVQITDKLVPLYTRLKLLRHRLPNQYLPLLEHLDSHYEQTQGRNDVQCVGHLLNILRDSSKEIKN